MIRYSPDGTFWDLVADRYWQQQPFAFQVAPDDSPFDRDSVFRALASDAPHDPLDWIQVAVRPDPQNVRDYRVATFRRAGPRPADEDLAGYFARMAGTPFGFNVHDLVRRNPALAAPTGVFAERLGGLPGPRVRRWEVDAFGGTYPVTPLGIHRDNGGVFSFCVLGRRTYLLWPGDHFARNHPDLTRPDPAAIARHADAAVRIEVEPGLGVYWPPSNWHVVLADGSPFVMAQVSAYFEHADLDPGSPPG